MTDTAQREILLVEDNPGDAMLAREAFVEAGVDASLRVLGDGESAVSYLRGEDEHAGRELPELILLDLKLPGKDGTHVLREVKGDEGLRRIPILVLTTSGADQDINAAYELHANSYLRKPVSFSEFVELARAIDSYWLTLVCLPPT
jgi:chemotaxis family two-component system response regulator Rcp1